MSAVEEVGLYGRHGWTVESGVKEILGAHKEFIFGDPSFARFNSADEHQISQLAEVLPAGNWDDYQNASPTLGDFVRACLTHPGQVKLSGYVIGPPRHDERVTVDGLTLEKCPVEESILAAFEEEAGQNRLSVWQSLGTFLGIDAGETNVPDEMLRFPIEGKEGCFGWWLWWD